MDTIVNIISKIHLSFYLLAWWGIAIVTGLFLLQELKYLIKGDWKLKRWFKHRKLFARLTGGFALIILASILLVSGLETPIPSDFSFMGLERLNFGIVGVASLGLFLLKEGIVFLSKKTAKEGV